MALRVYEHGIELIRNLRPLAVVIGRHDRALADQLRRAASSVPLNIAEGSSSLGGNKRVRYRTAAGSAREVQAALDVAEAWGYLAPVQTVEARKTLDGIHAMLFRLAG